MNFNIIQSLDYLKLKGLPVSKFVVVDNENALKEACERLGYPLVAKIVAFGHKLDKGGVLTNITNYEQALKFLKKKKKIVLQKQASGIELFLGIKKDRVFGQVIMFGIGGVLVEILRDISLRICPVDTRTALEMIKEIKSSKLLEGYRGFKPVDVKKLSRIIVELSQIAVEDDIKELDINPIFADGSKFAIVDARLIL